MKSNDIFQMLEIFSKRDKFRKDVWCGIKQNRDLLVHQGSGSKDVLKILTDNLYNLDENVVMHIVEVLGLIADSSSIQLLEEKYERIEKNGVLRTVYSWAGKRLHLFGREKKKIDHSYLEELSPKELVNIFAKHGSSTSPAPFIWEENIYARDRLVKMGEVILEELYAVLNTTDNNILTNVIEIIGEIGNRKDVSILEKLLERKLDILWGSTIRELGYTLVKLGSERGYELLKWMVKLHTDRPESRLDGAIALRYFGLKDVFKNDEIDYANLHPRWVSILRQIVDELMEE